MIGVGYVRVSTDQQNENGVSMQAQIDAIKKYCASNDIQLAGIYGDPAESGDGVEHRPGALSALYLADRKRINCIVITKIDRLSRNTTQTLAIKAQLDKKKVKLVSIYENIDTTTFYGKFYFQLLASLAEMERNLISERTKTALAFKRNNGERISRHAPLGSKLHGTALVKDEKEMVAALLARQLRQQGLSLAKIARELKGRGYVNRAGHQYHSSSVQALVNLGEKLASEASSKPGNVVRKP
jgi:site-specific DNA recombinase